METINGHQRRQQADIIGLYNIDASWILTAAIATLLASQ